MTTTDDHDRSGTVIAQFDTAEALAMVQGHAEIYAEMEDPDA